jgi:predicted DNA-binding ribbon-helix-helix protein
MIDSSRHGQQSTLVSRNVTISGHRTSIRLEADMWEALFEICRREGKTVHAICSVVDGQRIASRLTAALRVYIMAYYRAAATEVGHAHAGHGTEAGRKDADSHLVG